MAWIWPTRAMTASALIGRPRSAGPRSARRGPRSRCSRGRSSHGPAEVHVRGELVELDALAARHLGLVLRVAALLEALEDLALAAGVAKRAAPGVDLRLEAVER